MNLYPAIDIRGGRCVRLHQGEFGRETVYGDDPVAQARSFVTDGAAWLHVVDLDAARTGEPVNRGVIGAIAAAVDVPIQSGGGVRSVSAAEALFEAGVARVVIGTAALTDPDLVRVVAHEHPVAVGLDTRAGELVTNGWTTASGRSIVDVVGDLADAGLSALIVTDVGRDGTLAGPDVEGLRGILALTELDVIASGGVGSIDDLRTLATLENRGRSLAGAIVGKAFYEGRIGVAEAVGALAPESR